MLMTAKNLEVLQALLNKIVKNAELGFNKILKEKIKPK